MAWLQHRHLEHDVEEPLAPATRLWNRRPGTSRSARPLLRLLRPTGTA
jgi:hypothetical protein